MSKKDLVSEEVLQELINKLEEIVNNYCYNLEYFTPTDIEGFFDGTQQEIDYYSSLIKDDVVSKNFLHSSKQIADDIAQSILEANEYTDSLLKNISSIQLEWCETNLPTTGENNKIYILPVTSGSTTTVNTLNIWNNTSNDWVSIGNLEIDITQFYNKTEIDTKMDLKANKTEVVANDKIVQTLDSATNSSNTILSTSGLQVELDKKANDNEVIKKTDLDVSQTDLMQYVNTDLFDTTYATVNVIKCGRNVQLNIQALLFKQEMNGLNNLVVLNAIPEEYRPLTLTETTMYATNYNIAGRGFIDSNGILYNFFYYDSTKGSSKIGGYLFGTFNYISAK